MCTYYVWAGPTGTVQLKQLATDYSQQKRTTWAGRGRIIIAQSKPELHRASSGPVYYMCTQRVQVLVN